jgi:hypothetical protein
MDQKAHPSSYDSLSAETDPMVELSGQLVVLDTAGPLIYVGTLRRVTPHAFELIEADVHDMNDSRSTKDFYLLQTRDLGVRPNRAMVLVHRSHIISVSRLADITD